jgi:SAM-dependent methyltransferase
MPERFGPFNVVFCGNLLCRLPDPMLFLDRLPSILKPGGVVVLVSPYSWLEEYTPEVRPVHNDIHQD